MTVYFSNPRLTAEFTDWPLGGKKRGACRFHVEPGRTKARFGEDTFRVGRTTTGKTKYHTYGGRAAIVDGSDGRTYILQERLGGRFIQVSRHDFMDAAEAALGFPAAVWPDHERFAGLKQLIDVANRPTPPNMTVIPPDGCSLRVGVTVRYTNENGVAFEPRTVIGFTRPEDTVGNRTVYIDSDSPWFPVDPKALAVLNPPTTEDDRP